MGTTFTGEIDPIKDINDLLMDIKKEKGWDIPIHVDAASGGFILPFTEPDFEWDFRLDRVRSINVSGHKYGLTYPGLGWLIFSDEKDLPKDLIFTVNYLGEEEETYTLNFSGGGCNGCGSILQYIKVRKGWIHWNNEEYSRCFPESCRKN